LTGEFFRGSQFDTSLVTRLDPKVDFDFAGNPLTLRLTAKN
jgi:hypothetical protein